MCAIAFQPGPHAHLPAPCIQLKTLPPASLTIINPVSTLPHLEYHPPSPAPLLAPPPSASSFWVSFSSSLSWGRYDYSRITGTAKVPVSKVPQPRCRSCEWCTSCAMAHTITTSTRMRQIRPLVSPDSWSSLGHQGGRSPCVSAAGGVQHFHSPSQFV